MIISNFNKQTKILETEFTVDVSLNEIINYIIATKKNKTYPRLLKIKTNATTANFTFSIDDLEKIVIENRKSLEKYDFIIDAIIVEDPKTTVISMLYKELEKNKKYKFNIFSTEKAATMWLKEY
ncbi:hypothetical protein ACFQ5N_08170 [Lutibacter holmesii]|uniref:STAS/SEC14 domain-containing protein n=1 Tax=Lutibacter holmesii TaxID=1137985 RepID=A0ABW3WPH5_9FLAO